MKRKDAEIHGQTHMANSGKGRVNGPTCANARLKERGGKQKKQRGWEKPEREVIQTRKSYVRSTNKKRNESITKTTHHGGYYKKKNHNKGMSSDNYIVKLIIAEKGTSRTKFKANNHGESRTKEGRPDTKNEIKRTNILVISGKKPT